MMPPRYWLRAVLALRTRPQAYAATMRRTRTMPRSGSMETSANTAPNPRPVCGSFCPGFDAPVAMHHRARRRRHAMGGIGRAGEAEAERQAAVTHRARLRRAARPSEFFGGLRVALLDRLAGPWLPAGRVGVRVIDDAELH